jgi:hypothetical protein
MFEKGELNNLFKSKEIIKWNNIFTK